MKGANLPRCRFCGVTLMGAARECVRCFALHTLPCPKCVIQSAKGVQRLKRHRESGEPVNCKFCGNKRFVLRGD